MRVVLKPHPDTPCSTPIELCVKAGRGQSTLLELDFHLTGAVGDVMLPADAVSERTDGLWQHTCFEAFLRIGDGPAYFELNLAPSQAWATYRFDAYRAGMKPAERLAPCSLEHIVRVDTCLLRAAFDLEPCGEIASDRPWRIGLSTVIEEQDGRKSYWALAHPPGKPDFHHPDCFVLDLPPP